MHHCVEVVIPPMALAAIPAAVDQAFKGWSENDENHKEYGRGHAFYDWYTIGGRWSGHKLTARIGKEKLEAFYAKLQEMKVTVSAFTAGKESLRPESQTEDIDRLWREMVPGFGDVCPLFDHYEGDVSVDVYKVSEIPAELTCARLCLAMPEWYNERWKLPIKLRIEAMLATEMWNGATLQDTDFDGNVKKGIDRLYARRREHYKPPHPEDDWLVVTVDCHN